MDDGVDGLVVYDVVGGEVDAKAEGVGDAAEQVGVGEVAECGSGVGGEEEEEEEEEVVGEVVVHGDGDGGDRGKGIGGGRRFILETGSRTRVHICGGLL